MQKPLILVCNDDGIHAPGIRKLIKLILPLGEVYVVAPDKPQSGMGHAVTINSPIYAEEVRIGSGAKKEWSCSGTPADCVKLAKSKLLPRKPDLCVSGINHGSNASINVMYSGTMSAAIEAGMEGIPAIGFSLCDYRHDADFDQADEYIVFLAKKLLAGGLTKNIVLNVNIPAIGKSKIKGIKIARQAKANWAEEYLTRKDPRGREYYWLTGKFVNNDNEKDTDEWALENNYISVVPTQFDLTAHQELEEIKQWGLKVRK